MKTYVFKPALITGLLFILISVNQSYGQDTLSEKSQMLDVKLQLLDSKLELLDMKIKLWESKPQELDIRLDELDEKIDAMEFEPQDLNRMFRKLDSLLNIRLEADPYVQVQPQVIQDVEPEIFYEYTSAIMLDPVRLLEGTFHLSYERALSNKFSVNVGVMATYSTSQGLSNYYFSNQEFAFFDIASNSYNPFEGEVMSGAGVSIQLRNYLLPDHSKRHKAPLGLYAAPQLMYRRLSITGNYMEYEEIEPGIDDWVEKSITQHLNIYAGGVILGYKLPLFKVLSIDIFAGGNIRMSKYSDEDGFTKYKSWFNFDFSGVSPVAGITIGILK